MHDKLAGDPLVEIYCRILSNSSHGSFSRQEERFEQVHIARKKLSFKDFITHHIFLFLVVKKEKEFDCWGHFHLQMVHDIIQINWCVTKRTDQ